MSDEDTSLDRVIRFVDLSGKGITMPARKVDAGIPIVRSTDLSGKGIVFPATKIEPGDPVIRLADLSGKGIVVRADGGAGNNDSSAVDPVKELHAIIDPENPRYIIITWVPGANNDAVHLEMGVDHWCMRGQGDEHASFDVPNNQWEPHIIQYFAWHYITAWGMRNGKYSKAAAGTQIWVDFGMLWDHISDHCTFHTGSYYRDGWYSGGAGWRNPTQDFHNNDWNWQFPNMVVSWLRLDCAKEYVAAAGSGADWFMYGDMRAVRANDAYPYAGETLYSVYPRDYAVDGATFGPGYNANAWIRFMNVSEWIYPTRYWGDGGHFSVYFDWPGDWTQLWIYKETDNYMTRPLLTPTDTSWDIMAGQITPGAGPHRSGSVVCTPTTGGFLWATGTCFFYDGSTYNASLGWNRSWFAYRIADADRGILEVWAHCPGYWNPLTMSWEQKNMDHCIYFGEIMLCNNYDFNHNPDYHGWLPISLIGDLDGP